MNYRALLQTRNEHREIRKVTYPDKFTGVTLLSQMKTQQERMSDLNRERAVAAFTATTHPRGGERLRAIHLWADINRAMHHLLTTEYYEVRYGKNVLPPTGWLERNKTLMQIRALTPDAIREKINFAM